LKDFYRYDSHSVQLPWLECVNGLPLRTPLAGLIGFAPAFCNDAKAKSPRAAAIAKEFRTRVRNSDMQAAEGGNSASVPLQKAVATIFRPASGVRGGDRFPYSSQGIRTARAS
jgi:hypothetical protein